MLPDESAAAIATSFDQMPGEHRLAESRAELETLLVRGSGGFPRSHTMRFLLSRGGGALAIGAFAGLLTVKPRLATALIRILPLGRLVRRLL